MGETRVDLHHLLEDLRDAYSGALEETILTEIVANCLDSGAGVVQVGTDPALSALTVVDDQWPDQGYFAHSDQIWFARRGVPSIFLSSSGPDEHYHRASDEMGTIEADFTARISRLSAWLVRAVAEDLERPRWDEAARRSLQIAR